MKNKSYNKTIIEVENLTKSFNDNIVLNNINFKLMEGESLAIIGESGSGKSVLLKNIIGLLKPDKGSIKINGLEMVNLKRSVKERILLEGDIPSPMNPPKGCHFHPRCWKAIDDCSMSYPPVSGRSNTHNYRCYNPMSK